MSEIVCSKGKRRRGANFSKADLVFLCKLVEKNITILRSKQTNSITNAEKAKVWKEITDSVNTRAGGQKRSVEQIKEKWRKACSTAKLEAAIDKKSLNQTGGVQLCRRQAKLHKQIMELHTEAPNFVRIDNGTDVGVVASLFPNITATCEPTNQIESHGQQGHNY
jgi:hypothetical protein